MILISGHQLRAARALTGIGQKQLADAAKVNVNTIRNMESRGREAINSGAVTLKKVLDALERLGIEFLNHGQPGVRLRKISG